MKRVFAFLVLACLSLNASAQSYDRANDIVYRQGEPTCNLDVAYPAEKGENLPADIWLLCWPWTRNIWLHMMWMPMI